MSSLFTLSVYWFAASPASAGRLQVPDCRCFVSTLSIRVLICIYHYTQPCDNCMKRRKKAGAHRPNCTSQAGLFAPPDGGTRLCGRWGANLGGRTVLFSPACLRLPTVEQGFAGGGAQTWADARRFFRRPVCAPRRWIKAFPAARRKLGRTSGAFLAGLFAPADGGSRLSRRLGANLGGRPALFSPACLRLPTVEQGFAGGEAQTWAHVRRMKAGARHK